MADKNNPFKRIRDLKGLHPKDIKDLHINNGHGAFANYQKTDEQLKKERKIAHEKSIREKAKKVASLTGGPFDKFASENSKKVDKIAESIEQEGVTKTTAKEIAKKRIRKSPFAFVLVFFAIFFIVIFYVSNADSQIFSNENDGTYISDKYIDDKLVNVFANYPGLYEKIVEKTQEVSDKYKIEIDKYLVISTLVAPIQNELIIPVDDHTCGEENCYYFNGESKTWKEFLSSWGDQAELLSKMQIMTFTNASLSPVSCGSEKTMEQISQNDYPVSQKPTSFWESAIQWFKGFRNSTEAEMNAYCTSTPSGKTLVPVVTTQSTLQAEYFLKITKDKEYELEKNAETGGVYYWNLVNKNGFLYEYLKDYLSDDHKEDPDLNYEINRAKIVDIANYIYTYYDSIKKTCYGHKVLESSIEKIKIYNPPEKQKQYNIPEYQEIDFEEQYVGGVLLAEFHSSGIEGLKAFAILVRSEAIANVGLDGGGTIENSSNKQNYNPTYSAEKYPDIAEAVKQTRGMVLSKYESPEVWHTEYDAFCPVSSTLENGFYYLPDGQQNLPINPAKYKEITGKEFINSDSEYLKCPCFQSLDGMPSDDFGDKRTRYIPSSITPPTEVAGNPPQATDAACWNTNKKTQTDENGSTLYGWTYHATGGHGRGASQYGIKYFDAFGYNQDAILRLFFPGAQVRVLSSLLPKGVCSNVSYYTGEKKIESVEDIPDSETSVSYSEEYTGSNYMRALGGRPLDKPLEQALAARGKTVQDLSSCIKNRVNKAGAGTREGVVEAAVGLITCTYDLTGGYTYPYNHSGSDPGNINHNLGINVKWGTPGGSCPKGPCRLGLNCATFVRVSMCNGGMNSLCSQGSRAAHEMFDRRYFPGSVKVMIAPEFRVVFGNTTIKTAEDAFNSIKPGDMLYSEHYPRIDELDHGNHVMVVVGKTNDALTIAENGRDIRVISKRELLSPGRLQYGILLLDGFYSTFSK